MSSKFNVAGVPFCATAAWVADDMSAVVNIGAGTFGSVMVTIHNREGIKDNNQRIIKVDRSSEPKKRSLQQGAAVPLPCARVDVQGYFSKGRISELTPATEAYVSLRTT